jgi:alkylated DNA repair dioxygenase AlkB
MELFTSSKILTPIPVRDGELSFLPQLELDLPNDEVLARLIAQTEWRSELITVWGKQHRQPRLTAWHGDAAYTYSGLRLEPQPFTPLQQHIRGAVEAACGRRFNSVLLNYYRDGRDSMGMHSDNEPELGPEPAIASVSFGAERTFTLHHKNSGERLRIALTDGSLLLMSGKLQHYWLHGIKKTARPVGARVNLTFRYIV